MTEKIKKPEKKNLFTEKRVSVMNHGGKVREKQELAQMVDIVTNHASEAFWEANLRTTTSVNNRKSLPPRTAERL